MENVVVVPSPLPPAASVIEGTAANSDAYLESNDLASFGLTDFRREHLITVEAHKLYRCCTR